MLLDLGRFVQFHWLREASPLLPEQREWFEKFTMLVPEGVGPSWTRRTDGAGSESSRTETGCFRRVAEYVEYAGRRCDWLGSKKPGDPRSKFILRIELLESAFRRYESVPVFPAAKLAGFEVRAGRNDECPARERPGVPQYVYPLLWGFNDVDDVPKVHDLGWSAFVVRSVGGIPAGYLVARFSESCEVATAAAAVVEH